jgi:transcriptional regulator with PAS, ATPase and Fis domain
MRVGGKTPKRVDVRIIAATNVNLAELIESKRFRKDLYYRLNVLTFRMPSLRERKEDLAVLLDRFIEMYNKKMDLNVRGFTKTAMQYIMEYDWPGNIRELENMVERAMNLSSGEFLSEKELGHEIFSSSMIETDFVYSMREHKDAGSRLMHMPMGDAEEAHIRNVLRSARGNVTRAAKLSGVPKRTLYRRIEKYGIQLSEYRA